ncbi:MAG TPA: catalase [Albitalea sp.]|nr:catalase [Albitalea sp.]
MTPSTEWREQVAPDEAKRFAGYARQFVEMQRAKSARFGNGRALHRVQHLGLKARLEVLAGLPEHARHGLFARPAAYEAWVRLSNGAANRAPNSRPDVRGFSFKVMGVHGPGALGHDTQCQDFALIQRPAFAYPKTDEFVGLALHGSEGPLALLKYMVGRYGLVGGLRELKRIAAAFAQPFTGFATTTFYSAAPIACGPYAARVRLVPADTTLPPARSTDWGRDMAERLRRAPLVYQVQLQFYVDEAITPIEDASVDWPSPYVTVAQLSVVAQDVDSSEGRRLAEQVEAAIFDPWDALAAHRPLGDVMRARKVTYFESQKARGAV